MPDYIKKMMHALPHMQVYEKFINSAALKSLYEKIAILHCIFFPFFLENS